MKTCTCRPDGGRVSSNTAAAGTAGAVVSCSEPAHPNTGQMKRFTGVVTAQDGAVVVDAFHRRVLRRSSNIRAANRWPHIAQRSASTASLTQLQPPMNCTQACTGHCAIWHRRSRRDKWWSTFLHPWICPPPWKKILRALGHDCCWWQLAQPLNTRQSGSDCTLICRAWCMGSLVSGVRRRLFVFVLVLKLTEKLFRAPDVSREGFSFTHMFFFFFLLYQSTVLSSRAVDGHQMYFGGSVVGKASTIGVGISSPLS